MRFLCCLLLSCTFATGYAKPVEIVFWHAMAGNLDTAVQELAMQFNKSQQEFIVKPIYKGSYIELLTSFAAAFRAHHPPALVQVFEVGTNIMLHPPGIIKPVNEVLLENRTAIPIANFFPAVRQFYSDQGSIMAMPFNISIPVMFYNQEALAKAGYPEFPKTWEAFEYLAAKLKSLGYECIYTTAYPAWILIESFAAIHGIVDYNDERMIAQFERLKQWQKLHYFEYGGRTDSATLLFTSGRCPIFSQSSGNYNGLLNLVSFKLGIAPMPFDTKVSPHRYANLIGGGAIWVVANEEAEVYRGVALFFKFLSQSTVQKRWFEQTGYLPLGVNGAYQSLNTEAQPLISLAKLDLDKPKKHSKIPFDAQNQIRNLNDEAIEFIFANLKSPKQALNDAVSQAGQLISRFAKNTRVN